MELSLSPIRKPFFFAGAACLVASVTLAAPLRDDLTEKDRSRVLAVTAPTTDFTKPNPFEAMSGGATTSTGTAGGNAFSQPSATMPFERKQDFKLGNALFRSSGSPHPPPRRLRMGSALFITPDPARLAM